jgi:four helix bundle protein
VKGRLLEPTGGPREVKMAEEFNHEKLDVYRLSVEVARWAATVPVPSHRRHLRDQLARAADSVVLNLAEGSGHPRGAARWNHYRIARGSAAEVCAVLDLLRPRDARERQVQLRRIAAMLSAMLRR